MPHLTRPLTGGEAVVRLSVGTSTPRTAALVSAGLRRPAPVMIRAVIDTGATRTVIHGPLLAPLGLTPTGRTLVHTPSTGGVAVARDVYDVRLSVPDVRSAYVIGNRPVIATDLTGTGTDALIGCDVLASCLFVYDGSAGTFTLAF